MTSIQQNRENAMLPENNTAQREWEMLLESMPPNSDNMIINVPLTGSLNLSKLDRFPNLTKIVFQKPGELTELNHLPKGLRHLECIDQWLTELTDLPNTLESIDITENYLERFDFADVPKLKIFRATNNRLEELLHLPPTLEVLECNQNHIRELDLAEVHGIQVLHVSQNPRMILKNKPASVRDFEMDNAALGEKTDDHEPKKKGEKDVIESLYEYFRLKAAYERKERELKRAAFRRETTRKMGAKKARLVRAPCIQCKRKVGTIFAKKNERYVAICGDKDHPCSLNMRVRAVHHFQLQELLQTYHEQIEDKHKPAIIRQKLDTLFGYMEEAAAVREFKHIMEEYSSENASYKDLLGRYEIAHGLSKTDQIRKKQAEVYEIQEGMKIMLAEYAKTGNREILRTIAETQKRDLEPEIQNLRMLKYGVMEMDMVGESGARLVQHPYALDDIAFSFS